MERTLTRIADWRPVIPALAWTAFVMLGMWTLLRTVNGGHGVDAEAYWDAWDGAMYERAWQESMAYVYSPAFAQAIWPLALLEWPVFLTVWTVLELFALVIMTGPLVGAALLVPYDPVWHEVRNGNIDLFVGLAIALSFRWPAAWAFVLLSKVTPGIGVLWFAARREWRSLGIALGATAAIAAVSFVLAPDLWAQWVALLVESPDTTPHTAAVVLIPLPLSVRLAIAGVIVIWAARTDRRWALIVACFVAAPLPTIMRASMLVAILMVSARPSRRADAKGHEHALAPG